MRINKDNLASTVSATTGIKKYVAKEMIDEIFNAIELYLIRGDDVVLKGFGTFSTYRTKERIGTDINNDNAQIIIPAKKKVKFRAGKTLAEDIEKNIY
jgi:DNA-binding protein HU-beta